MKKHLYFDKHSGLILAALTDNGNLIELAIEREENKDLVGNIYKGKVINVIESMNAAFVDCGLEKNCFLSLSGGESFADESKYHAHKKSSNKNQKVNVTAGDEVIVQVVKNPRGSKGAKVTTKLSFVGKNLIYLPQSELLAISRKISENELRDNLLFMVDKLRGKGEGLIVRTVAPYATATILKAEVKYLKNLYAVVLEKNKTAPVGAILHKECELPMRVLRDNFNEDISQIIVGEKGLYDELLERIRLRPGFKDKQVTFYEGEGDMFADCGIAQQVVSLAKSSVELINGGELVIENTEAMTVIDVNTKKYLGNENLEDTVYAVNISAAREIARQVRLRNIGGIVTVDFIDMENERHKAAVTEELQNCLKKDRVKCKVLPMNEFCLSVFTRQRKSSGVASKLLQPCTHCQQNGYILSNEFVACLIRGTMINRFIEGAETLVIEMNRGVMEYLRKRKMLERNLLGWENKKVYLVPHRTYHEEQFTVAAYKAGEKVFIPDDAVLLKVK